MLEAVREQGAMTVEALAERFGVTLQTVRRDVRLLPDGWTVITRDHSLSAQWEHTILVTPTGHEVLTLGASEQPPA